MKQTADFQVTGVERMGAGGSFALLRLRGPEGLTRQALPGQFVNVAVESPGRLLRRPISVCNVDDDGLLWLLVRDAGPCTHRLVHATRPGDTLNLLCFLGRGFTLDPLPRRPLLIGGGVGVAPMLLLARRLAARGVRPTLLTGARTASALLLAGEFAHVADLLVTTDDGSAGFRGMAHEHPALHEHGRFDACFICGPKPMMQACARGALKAGIPLVEVSLENMMACGLGACLCCVEPVRDEGNVTVCTNGPVFNARQLEWNLE